MAETVTVVTPVIDMLVQLLLKRATLFRRVHGEVKSLKDELESIQCFLIEAEEKLEKGDVNDGVKTWVKQVREEAYHIEDVMDEYLLRVAQRSHLHGFIGLLHKTGHFFKSFKSRNDVAFAIKSIKASLREIKDRGERYGFNSLEKLGSSSSRALTSFERYDPRLGSLFIGEDEFMDVYSTRDELVTRLVEGELSRTVISFVGEGGVGKTTLAKQVYDNEMVKGHFDCRAWFTVSQAYNPDVLLMTMKRYFCPTFECNVGEIDMMKEVISQLRQCLQAKRYVFVFDDVWHTDFWGVMKYVLPNNDKGSRVIITTRNDAVVASCKDTVFDLVKKLQPWSQESSWELFLKKAFQFERDGCCPLELKQLSLEIVRQCQGLPLVIAAVAGLLSTKEKVLFEWKKIYEALCFNLEGNPQLSNISKILSLSYYNLPYYLKYCLLYFGIFPRNHLVPDVRLYRYWIAEGFVKERREKTLEQVAEEYLNELIQRNLVQVWNMNFSGSDKLCRVHDLMHDMIFSKAGELGFCNAFIGKKSSLTQRSRRLAVYSSSHVMENVEDYSARSIFVFNNELTTPFVEFTFEKFKLLKVLDFSNTPLDCIPEGLGSLHHLRSLNLRNTKVRMLPKSICKLNNLETLDIVNTQISELPIEINKLRNLRHLLGLCHDPARGYGIEAFQGQRLHRGIGHLEELQTLSNVQALHNEFCIVKELELLTQLRWLGISKLTEEMGRSLCTSIEKMNNLERLTICSTDTESEILDLHSISSPPHFLQRLNLMGPLDEFPRWIVNLPYLSRLSLFSSRLSDEPLKYLCHLPNLSLLWLCRAYNGEKLLFKESGFQKLKLLEVSELYRLNAVTIENGSLPLLEEVRIGSNPQLKEVPSGMQNLRSLKLLEISQMPSEFVLGLQRQGLQDSLKVKHVPSISSWYRGDGDLYDVFHDQ
ncbi:disease resistance protein RPM1 [Morus notabilis]|uniref:disease resistance protein RPM1 n=1 Tax=Morus notabilis TaxID=981085 RepID=UPI000CED6CD0|nr:disease resistance protein RPM1 [Morus notabilis]